MFGSTTLDIVIGLILVYLLYSLLVTILAELISNWLGLRARILRMSIELMLNDNNYYEIVRQRNRLLYWLYRIMLYEFPEFKDSLAGKFYDQPSIKYLSTGAKKFLLSVKNSKPAYFSSSAFSDTIIHLFRDKGNGDTDITRIAFCLKYNTLHIQPETLKHIRNLFNDAKGDIGAFEENLKRWFSDTQDRASGWYKRKLTLILFILGFIVALSFNVNSIFIARLLSKDKAARDQLVNLSVQLAKDTTKYKEFVLVNGDTIRESKILDTAFKNVKKDISDANMILGLGWHWSELKKPCCKEITEKCDSIEYALLLRLKKNLEEINDSLGKASETVHAFSREKNSIYFLRVALKADSMKVQLDSNTLHLTNIRNLNAGTSSSSKKTADSSLRKLSDSLAVTKAKIQNYSDLISLLDQKISFVSASMIVYKDSVEKITQKINELTNSHFIFLDSIENSKKGSVKVHGQVSYNPFDKVCYVVVQSFTHEFLMLGFILTALAISLGAPFWFDLLRKLVAIRGSGVKPEEKVPETKMPGSDTSVKSLLAVSQEKDFLQPQQPDDLFETALETLTMYLKDDPGVVAIGLENLTPQNSQGIVVHVENNEVRTYLIKKYGESITVQGEVIPIKYYLHQPIMAHKGTCGCEIANKSLALGHGTLGCFLIKENSDTKFILSCWHVMKDNIYWDNSPKEKEIVDGQNNVIGTIQEGCLTDFLDIGIAKCNDQNLFSNQPLPIRSQHRKVVAYDALLNTEVTFYGKVSQLKKAKIFHHKVNAILRYPGEMSKRVMHDTFSISIIDPETGSLTSPTSAGDSGAVVVDNNFAPLGMIIGGNDKVSYAIKFTNAFDQNKIYSQYSFLL